MEKENPCYYGIIPANVRYDKELTANAKLLYSELTCLSQKEGYCFSSNSYFAELYGVTTQAISKWINQLAEKGYVHLEYVYNGKEVKERRIYIIGVSINNEGVSTNVDGGINKRLKGYQQKIKDNNTSINNINNNIYTESEKPETKDSKHKHGEFKNVLLSDEEYNKLVAEYGEEKTTGFINNFSQLKEMKGYKYKSDYLALKKWGIRAYEDSLKKNGFKTRSGAFDVACNHIDSAHDYRKDAGKVLENGEIGF